MAVDTAAKRASVVSFQRPWRPKNVWPDGTLTAEDRAVVAWGYGGNPAGAPPVGGSDPQKHLTRSNAHIIDRVRKRRFGQRSFLSDSTLGIGLEIGTSTGLVNIKSGTSTEIGGFLLMAADVDLTDSSGGSATSTIASATNIDALTDSTGGTVDDTVSAITGSGADAAINNNFKELTDQIISQQALNTVLINAVASLAADSNDLRAKMRTSGILDT